MRVLVGILKSGEEEFESCIHSLKEQTVKDVEYFVLENMPNKQAHDTLYRRFMDQASSCDCFLKLDADMVFARDDALEQMLGFFENDVAHLFAYVFDVPSAMNIPGIQMFRSDAVWEGSDELLNVDYAPRIGGQSITLIDGNFIKHMPSPSNFQLFRYGIHKAIKSIQPDRDDKNAKKGILHAAILHGIARNYFLGHQKLCWAMIGAMLVYSGKIVGLEYNSAACRSVFVEIDQNRPLHEGLVDEARRYWGNEIQSLFRWLDLFHTARWQSG